MFHYFIRDYKANKIRAMNFLLLLRLKDKTRNLNPPAPASPATPAPPARAPVTRNRISCRNYQQLVQL